MATDADHRAIALRDAAVDCCALQAAMAMAADALASAEESIRAAEEKGGTIRVTPRVGIAEGVTTKRPAGSEVHELGHVVRYVWRRAVRLTVELGDRVAELEEATQGQG